ncbi:hypothetical protein F0344_14775 [Streptomyces finlayi]|uniref:Uncharacterized protein n=1 Tax=Streptomyces finlayi TaxID=67296 RepID=A0A7G7BK58_9ACTN|nr:hypothetical protein [Streptomyces finlayi]QNE75723.1 hypothetical protein F0344_14775 [Streptomyces finlayi]
MSSSTNSTTPAATWGYGRDEAGHGTSILHEGRIEAWTGARVRWRSDVRVAT